jgi:hypothetical protein
MMRLITVLSFFLTALAVQAGDEPCKADREKFCKDVKQGSGAIMHCMKEHASELSASCQSKMDEMKEKMKAAHEACHADREKFCKDVKMGEGRVIHCMKEHEAELSSGCKAQMTEMQKSKHADKAK